MSTSKKSQEKKKNTVNNAVKEQNDKRSLIRILLIVILVGVCVVALIPLIDYVAMNRTYINIDKEKIGRLEYDYRFAEEVEEQSVFYESLQAMLGISNAGGLTSEMVQSNPTMKSTMDQYVVNTLIENKMLLAAAKEEGFVYDTAEKYAAFEATIKDEAETAGESVNDYVKSKYGKYATMKRISPFVKEDIVADAFLSYKMEQFAPTEDELQAYYESNKDYLDFFDFWFTVVNAEEMEKSADLEAALKKAKANILTEGTLYKGMDVKGLDSGLLEWLFEADRKEGDVAAVKHSEKEFYYVLHFVDRYLDESPTADIRLIKTTEQNSKKILTLWKNGEATEESFAELCMLYSEDQTAGNGGLYEGLVQGSLADELNDWVYEDGRKPGDVTTIKASDGYRYVLYYVKQNDCRWKLTAQNAILTEKKTSYMNEIISDVVVKTPGDKVSYE